MKIRNELNQRLYKEKVYDQKSQNQHIDSEILILIKNGESEKLALFSDKIFIKGNMVLSSDELQNAKYCFVVVANIIGTECQNSGLSNDEADMISEIYCQKADRLYKKDEIDLLFKDMCMDFAERMQEIRKNKIISIHIRKAIRYIYKDLSADLSVGGLSQIAGLNKTYFAKLFKSETGMTVKEYVTSAKMDTAQNLLRYTNLTNSEIAVSLGYSSQSIFIYAFRKFTGVTPQKYRKDNNSV